MQPEVVTIADSHSTSFQGVSVPTTDDPLSVKSSVEISSLPFPLVF
jgi:hypothetical protein